jgi:hypothetical protein
MQIDWYREVGGLSPPPGGLTSSTTGGAGGSSVAKRSAGASSSGVGGDPSSAEQGAIPVATGKRVVTDDGRYRVYRPHNSALSVLIIRRAKKRDAGIYRCNLAGSSTRHKYMVLNVTGRCRLRSASLRVLVFCRSAACVRASDRKSIEVRRRVTKLKRHWANADSF